MTTYRAVMHKSATIEDHAWCEDCAWVSSGKGGVSGTYRASREARQHTEQSGHRTSLDRTTLVSFTAEPITLSGVIESPVLA